MEQREAKVRLWFDMWLQKKDLGIETLFTPDAVYIESWGPEYHGVEKIRHWFEEWNSRATVLTWDIKQFFHREDQTAVEWYFQNVQDKGSPEAFDGMTLIRWSRDGKIAFLQEFGCNLGRYDPYRDGPEPKFRDDAVAWF
jgi:ketosteroid isomerase-like protein